MKRTQSILWFLSGATFVAVLASPCPAATPNSREDSGVDLTLKEEEGQKLIRGVVQERTEKELSVTDSVDETKVTKFKLTSSTKYFKGDKEAKVDDVTVGSHVAVKPSNGSEGDYEAAEVNIIETKPLG